MSEPECLLGVAVEWLRARRDVRAIALVGSHARGAARPDSDVDLVVLTTDPLAFRREAAWVHRVPWAACGAAVARVADEDYGALWSRRITLVTGPELEIGFAAPSWAAVSPLDPGTRRVLRGGCRALYDPDGLLARLIAAAAS